MNRNRLFLVALATLSLLRTKVAAADVVLTAQIPNPHEIRNFAVWQGDSTIAVDVFGPGTFDNIWTVSRFGLLATQITTTTAFGLGASDPQWAPISPNSGFPQPTLPTIPPTMPTVANNQVGLLSFIAQVPGTLTDQLFVNGTQVSGSSTFANDLIVPPYSWSLDAANLVFIGASAAGEVSLNTVSWQSGKGATQIKDCGFNSGCGNPQWSPTDNVIAYDDLVGDIFLIDPDGGKDHEIVDGSLVSGASGPIWSPTTGTSLAFSCNNGTDICVSSSDGASPRNITNGALGLVWSNPTWRVDESFIAMLGRAPSPPSPNTPGDLYVIPAGGGTPVALTSAGNVRSPAFSPLIDEIFYICETPNGIDLCVISQSTASGGVPATCDATNCTGCCVQNICVAGLVATACGGGGNNCIACPPNETCSSVTHICSPIPCNSSTCPTGCCDSSNVCHAGTSTTSCGFGGLTCAICTGNQTCGGGGGNRTCVNTLCSSSTCNGCCDATGKCQAGTSNTACGANGLNCVDCNSSETCSASRTCQTQSCNISTCPTGCCDVTGHCQPGNSATSCGYSGFACVNCNGGVCDGNNHTCGAPSTCSSSNCVGCCGAADNQCHGGGTNAFCGSNGFTCETCSSTQSCSFSAGFCE